ncbi:MAG TPA: hypothetical protein GX736_01350 [Mogibacterium sp.]|nr:hypothetical protein [Mogibacterium sp.]
MESKFIRNENGKLALVLCEGAPEEAKESFKNYLRQIEEISKIEKETSVHIL